MAMSKSNRAVLLFGVALALLAAAPVQPKRSSTAGGAAERSERLELTPGQPPVSQSGTVVGDASVTYIAAGRKGQTLAVELKSTSTSIYFNLLPKGDPTAIYASATESSGNAGTVALPADGDNEIVVYLFRNAARRGARAPFTMSVGLK